MRSPRLHGAYNPGGFLACYDPPIVWIGTPPLGVGEVRSMLGDIVFELRGYEPGVGTAATTWGAVKALFE